MKNFKMYIVIFLGFLLLTPQFVIGGNFDVDFSSSTGFGISAHRFQINNINLDINTTNPLTGEAIVTNQTLNVLWEFNLDNIALYPVGVADANDTNACHTASSVIKVTNALTGAPLSGATITEGDNTVTTDTDGNATLTNLSSGNVSINVSAPNYLPQTTTLALTCDQETDIGVSLIPSNDQGVANGDIRIILSWGQNPEDLDSHLTGPIVGDNQNRFHIYYSNDNNCDGAQCDSTIPAWLDVDDTTSFGPETITITKVDGHFLPGRYRYSVHHYSGSENIPNSNAVVKVYVGDQLERTFYPPSPSTSQNVVEDWVWTVFELQIRADGTYSIAEVGTYSGPHDSSDLNAFSSVHTYVGVPVQSEDPELFKNLPAK